MKPIYYKLDIDQSYIKDLDIEMLQKIQYVLKRRKRCLVYGIFRWNNTQILRENHI